jgi:myo-inositol-1-phosphate synthase
MADSTRKKSVIVRVPPALKRRLAREVAQGGKSMNDLAVGILGSRFGVEVEESGRASSGDVGTSGVVVLRMPDALKDRLNAEARSLDSTTNDLIVRTLSETLGLRSRKEQMAASNDNARLDDGKVRVAIIGVGNCASALVQGIEYYKDASREDFVPGLMHVDVGGYHISDIEFTAAFDVTKDKVGKDLADAIWAHPNNTVKFSDVPKTGIRVSRGMTHDGLGKYISEIVEKAPGETDDVVGILRETNTDVVVNFLPVGSEAATKWYAEQILDAGCAMVNCMPVFIAREAYWQKRFEQAGLPVIGDDIKSQVGATITHRVLTTLFRKRGVKLDRTFQLNFGGNADFMNMLERERLESKKISKTNAVKSSLDYDLGEQNIHVGPSDHVPWLEDRKWAYIRLEGTSFGDVPLNIEMKVEVQDSPNSAGIVIDAVRLGKLALNNGIAGALEGPSSYFMKSPPVQYDDDEAYQLVEDFIRANTRVTGARSAPTESTA